LYENTSQAVPGLFVGDPSSTKIMLVGEAPGAEEDKLGLPFVGKAGRLLQQTLVELNLTNNIYITNIVKHRPPGNRKPTMGEVSICASKGLVREILCIKPQLILCLGRTPSEYFMSMADGGIGITREGSLRGLTFKIEHVDGWAIPVLCTWHPAYILRTPTKLDELKTDIQQAIAMTYKNEESNHAECTIKSL
jgi:DNA polymerase